MHTETSHCFLLYIRVEDGSTGMPIPLPRDDYDTKRSKEPRHHLDAQR